MFPHDREEMMAKYTEWCRELEEDLAAPFPPEELKAFKKGGKLFSFAPVWFYARRLNRLVGVGGWAAGMPVFHDAGGKLVQAVPITIFGVLRCNVGDEEDEHGGVDDEGKAQYGSASTNSWAQGFKRSMALFGVGLDQFYIYKGQTMPPRTFNDLTKVEIVKLNTAALDAIDDAKAIGKLKLAERDKIMGAIAACEHANVQTAVDQLNARVEAAKGGSGS